MISRSSGVHSPIPGSSQAGSRAVTPAPIAGIENLPRGTFMPVVAPTGAIASSSTPARNRVVVRRSPVEFVSSLNRALALYVNAENIGH